MGPPPWPALQAITASVKAVHGSLPPTPFSCVCDLHRRQGRAQQRRATARPESPMTEPGQPSTIQSCWQLHCMCSQKPFVRMQPNLAWHTHLGKYMERRYSASARASASRQSPTAARRPAASAALTCISAIHHRDPITSVLTLRSYGIKVTVSASRQSPTAVRRPAASAALTCISATHHCDPHCLSVTSKATAWRADSAPPACRPHQPSNYPSCTPWQHSTPRFSLEGIPPEPHGIPALCASATGTSNRKSFNQVLNIQEDEEEPPGHQSQPPCSDRLQPWSVSGVTTRAGPAWWSQRQRVQERPAARRTCTACAAAPHRRRCRRTRAPGAPSRGTPASARLRHRHQAERFAMIT